MKLDTYESKTLPNRFLTVPSGTDIARLRLPEEFFALTLVRASYEPPGPEDSQPFSLRVLEDIKQHGYAIHSLHFYERG
jgi:hypothetical protein